MRLDAEQLALSGLVGLEELAPLRNGEPLAVGAAQASEQAVEWPLVGGGAFRLEVEPGDGIILRMSLMGVVPETTDSFGLRIGRVSGVRSYLRMGYHSWDGGWLVEPDALAGLKPDPKMLTGHAVTAFTPRFGEGAVVLGFLRHDRFQSRFRFTPGQGPLCVDVECLWDRVPAPDGRLEAPPLLLSEHSQLEDGLRVWARAVAAASPLPPRIRDGRITGWCSWYNLYAAIDEAAISDHLAAARSFRDRHAVPLDVFLIDDGFTPEMGDWLEVKPQFPRGMRPLIDEVREAGFVPGLWIAPFMVGNRSRLFKEHPDWVVKERATGAPLATYTFYGEFRWHKRSEEYYTLDVTHPDAFAHIRNVFHVWAKEWGVGYLKTDFMLFGSDYGPDRACWHQEGLSRIEIWMRMARMIREEIGDALWGGSGCPLWAPIGLLDAVRIGRDIGVSWKGHYSAESLLRDQTSRNFANGILWQSDPDCILLRDRFHDLTDDQVGSLARFVGASSGMLMTSDHLGDLSPERQALFADLLRAAPRRCDFPLLGRAAIRYREATAHDGTHALAAESDPVIVQRVHRQGAVALHLFNTGALAAERLIPWSMVGSPESPRIQASAAVQAGRTGIRVLLRPFETVVIRLSVSGVQPIAG